MICRNCGNNNPDNANVCSACGAPMMMQPMQSAQQKGKGLAIASLVLGIVSFFVFAYIAGALAIILGGVAKKQGFRGGMATAGIVCGIVGIALTIILQIFIGSLFAAIF